MRLSAAIVALALAPASTIAFPLPFNFDRFRPGGNQNCAPPSVSTRVVTVTVTARSGSSTPAAPPPVNNGGNNNNNNSNNNAGGNGNGNTGNNTGGKNNLSGSKSAKPPGSTPPPPPPVNNAGGGQSSAAPPVQTGTSNTGNGNTGNGNNGTGNTGNGNNGNGNTGNGDNTDPQKSLVLDPRVIGSNFANDGQDEPTVGQVPSLTSTNNFINYCLTVPNLPITNGQQIQTGSCDPIPIGMIPSTDKMPSSKFVFPRNFGTLKANQPFTIQMAVQNLVTGNFVNAQKSYFAAPQQLDGNGIIKGHSHVVIERINGLQDTEATNPKVFEFFKGLNGVAKNGVLTADVTKGLLPGSYRLASINTAANHQPAIVPIAQHGSLDDMVYFEVTESGDPTPGNPGASTPLPPNAGASSGIQVLPSATPSASAAVSNVISEVASATATGKAGAPGTKPTDTETLSAGKPTAITPGGNDAKTTPAVTSSASAPGTTDKGSTNTGAGGNLQKFIKALLGEKAPAISKGGRGFLVEGSDSFLNLAAAIQRSCDIQKNKCADKVNASRNSGLAVSDCDKQAQECRAAN